MPQGHDRKDIGARFGKRIRRLRERRGWDQADLAAVAGLSRETISRIETGRQDALLSTQHYLAQSFEMTISQLMRGV